MQYRSKEVVEVIQYTSSNYLEIKAFVGESLKMEVIREAEHTEKGDIPIWVELKIKTLEGDMLVNNGDYVIRGVNGEFYPCKPDIFDKTYEKVEVK